MPHLASPSSNPAMPEMLDEPSIRRSATLLPFLALVALMTAGAVAPAGAQQRDQSRDATDAQQVRRGRAAIAGVVRDSAGRPLPGAFVSVPAAGATTFANDSGWFGLTDLPADTVLVEARRIGYQAVDFEIALLDGKTVEMVLLMRPVVQTLGTIVVEGERRDLTLFQNGFYRRKQGAAAGTFFSPDEMATALGYAPFSTVVRMAPGVRIETSGPARARHAYLRRAMGLCRMPVFLDGVLVRWADDIGLDRLAMPGTVHAVEIYPRNATLPPEFMTAAAFDQCGAIVVWSKPPRNDEGDA